MPVVYLSRVPFQPLYDGKREVCCADPAVERVRAWSASVKGEDGVWHYHLPRPEQGAATAPPIDMGSFPVIIPDVDRKEGSPVLPIAALLAWLASLAGFFAFLDFYVPPYQKLFMEHGLALPVVTGLLLSLSDLSRQIPAIAAAILIGVASVAITLVSPRGRSLAFAFGALALLALAAIGLGYLAIQLPLQALQQKL